jgi:hypothetical protein
LSSTSTSTNTHTSTLTKVVYVTRKVQADFLEILDLYGYFSESYARNLIADIRVFLDEEVIDMVRFSWAKTNSTIVLEELKYEVISGGIGLADDRPGGIGYRTDLQTADFSVRIQYNNRWSMLSDTEKQAVSSRLSLKWGPAGQLDYSGGKWINDRSYSSDGVYGLNRTRFCIN